MELRIKNIGLIKDSIIKLDGLTVITGKNGSGKTTVAKIFYSLFDAVSDINDKERRDQNFYAFKRMKELEEILSTFSSLYKNKEYELNDSATENYLSKLFDKNYIFSNVNTEKFTIALYNELKNFDIDNFVANLDAEIAEIFNMSLSNSPTYLLNVLKEEINLAIEKIDLLLIVMKSDPFLVKYTRKSIYSTLYNEFNEQILPIDGLSELAEIVVSDGDSIVFDFSLNDKFIINNDKPTFHKTQFKQTYFIDNPFALDSLIDYRFKKAKEDKDESSYFNVNGIEYHDEKLKRKLLEKNKITVLEELVSDDKIEPIKKMVNDVLPGEFEFTKYDNFYIQKGNRLNVKNLATGSKFFAIIKLLIEKGEINKETILILDEPESHLHPKWQNKFAEIIALLVKEVGVNILLNSHSSNFVLAIDGYMRKYDISRKTNFYQSVINEEGNVDYKCVNDDLGEIYSDFMESFSYAKEVRDNYYYGLDEDDSDV